METPVKREDEESGVWNESPLVFTSPGGNVSTRGRSRVRSERDEFPDENFQSKMSVSIPSSQMMPPPRLRSSYVTPLKPRNRMESQNPLFAFSPCKKTPVTQVSRPPLSAKKPRGKTAAQLKDEERELKLEIARRNQEKLYVSWLNLTLQNPREGIYIPEIRFSDVGREEVAKACDCVVGSEGMGSKTIGAMVGHDEKTASKGKQMMRGSKTRTSDFGALHSVFVLSSLRERLSLYFEPACQDEIISAMLSVAKRIDEGKLRMKEGCAVLADVGLRKQAMDVLICYSASWLKLGLYVVLGVECEDSNMQDTLEEHLFTHAGVAKEYATNRTVEGLYRQGYLEALGRVILKRLLLLVLVLDKLKCQTALEDGAGIDGLDGGSILLFRKGAAVKSSRQALQVILKNAMHGEGDLIAHLNVLGYRLHHAQDWLPEYSFQTSSMRDLQDGVRLCRLAQVMKKDSSILKNLHLPSNSKKRPKQHCEAALGAFERAKVPLVDEQGFTIFADSVLSGDMDVLLSLLWNVLLHLQIPLVINKQTVFEEVLRIEGMSGFMEPVGSQAVPDWMSMPVQDLLLKWTKAVCKHFSYEVQNFGTSFLDGQALCYLVSHYLPELLPVGKVQSCTKNGGSNFELLRAITRKLGFLDEVLKHCTDPDSQVFPWYERNVILFVGLLCSKLACTNSKDLLKELQLEGEAKLEGSAIRIQTSYRGWIHRNRYKQMRSSKIKILTAWKRHRVRQDLLRKKLAVKKIQTAWLTHLSAKLEKENSARQNAANVIQKWLRGYLGRKQFNRKITSAAKIQAAWRCFVCRKEYTLAKTSARKIECWWQTILLTRKNHELRHTSAVKIQAVWRCFVCRKHYAAAKTSIRKIECWWQTVVKTRKYLELRHAAIVVQAHCRCWSLRRRFRETVGAVRKIQALWRGRAIRKSYALQKACVLWIQKCWRHNRQVKSFCAAKIQAVWRGYLLRQWLSKQNKAAILLQSCYRSFVYRKGFQSYKKSVVLVQALLRGRLARKRYQQNGAARKIQAFWKHHAMKKKTASALAMQAAYQFWREQFLRQQKAKCFLAEHKTNGSMFEVVDRWNYEYEQARAAAITIQAHWRGFSVRKRIPLLTVSCFDAWRSQCLQSRKHFAAVMIQRSFRGWRKRNLFTAMRRSACLIQASWKGHVVRKCQNEEVTALRLRMQNTAATADSNLTLGNRLNEALALLLSFKTVSSILHVCATIDIATEHSRYCCERIAEGGAIIKILQLIQSTNRSTPHEEVLKHALSILGHLARYPVLARSIVDTRGSLNVITEQLQMNRNKEEIFFKAMRVIQLVCRESPQDIVCASPIVLRRLQHIKQLLDKKVETDRRAIERIPASSKSTSRLLAEKKLSEAKAQLQNVVNVIRALTPNVTPGTRNERGVNTVSEREVLRCRSSKPISSAKKRREQLSGYLIPLKHIHTNLDASRQGKRSSPAMEVPFWKLFKFADRLDVILMTVGTLAAIAHGLVLPANMYYFGRIVNALATNQGDNHAAGAAVLKLAIVMFIVAVNSGWVTWLEVWCWLYTGERQSSRIRVQYMESLLHQEIGFFDTEASSGRIVNHVASNMLLVQKAMGEKVGGYIHNMATFIGGVIVALFNGWQVALLAMGTVPLLVGTGAVYTRLCTVMFVKSQASRSRAGSIAQQTISQIRTVYAFVQEAQALKSFSEALDEAREIGDRCGMIKGLGLGLMLGIINCSWALELWFANILISRGLLDGGKVLTAVFCIVFGGMALGQTTPELQVFSRGKVAAYDIFAIIDRVSKVDSRAPEGDVLHKLEGSIELENLSFYYPARPDAPVLQNLSLRVPAGGSLALVGESGSGKSTVISLLQRYYDPTSGKIRVDGKDIKSLQVKWLRSKIAVVGQEPVLFATSIKENIRLGKPDATDEEVEASARASNAYAFIMDLPHGFETQIGHGTSQLSGGQKQRVAIARAMIRSPSILLLDEATSALDVSSEQIVKDALDHAMVGRTTVSVAHRLSTVRNSDMIAVFHRGSIAELGSHNELLERDGMYAALVRLQKTNQEDLKQEYAGDSVVNSKLPPVVEPQAASSLVTGPAKPKSHGIIKGIRTVYRITRRSWLEIILGSISAVLTGCINPLFALFLIEVVQLYYQPESRYKVNRWCAIIAGLGATGIVTNFFQHYLYTKTAEKLSEIMEEEAFKAILENEVEWFEHEENSSSSLTGKLSSNSSTLRSAMSDRVCLLLQYAASISLAITLGFYIKSEMAVITIATFPFSMVGGSMKQGFLQKGFAGDLEKLHSKASELAGEAVTNIRTLVSFCGEARLLQAFRERLSEPLKRSFIRAQISGLLFGLSQCGLHLANATGLWYISSLVKRGQSSYSDALKVFQILAWTGYVLAEALSLFPDMRNAVGSFGALHRITSREKRLNADLPGNGKPENLRGEFEFLNVEFCYPSRPLVTVLSKFNLHIESAKTTALVGASGSGKSSVIQLMLRFYEPVSGNILLDGEEIRSYNVRFIREHVSLVQQEPALFSVSIRENIAFGKKNATEAEVIAAARVANAHEFISSLPEGYDTNVGEGGVRLSGGQKQRIAIARAVIREASVLILDEATSALDSESQRTVQKALDEIVGMRRWTSVVVAHRLFTVQNAHTIAVLDRGRVVEVGSHTRLVENVEGVYSRMLAISKT